MKCNAGFVGFDGTENKRTLLALAEVKKAAGIDGDLNVLLRKPHGRLDPLWPPNRLYGVNAYLSDMASKEKWQGAGPDRGWL